MEIFRASEEFKKGFNEQKAEGTLTQNNAKHFLELFELLRQEIGCEGFIGYEVFEKFQINIGSLHLEEPKSDQFHRIEDYHRDDQAEQDAQSFSFLALSFLESHNQRDDKVSIIDPSALPDKQLQSLDMFSEINWMSVNCILISLHSIQERKYVVALNVKPQSVDQSCLGSALLFGQRIHQLLKQTRSKEFSISIQLSDREKQVLRWSCHGKTSYEIGKILDLSEHTVNNYIANLTKKLGANSRVHAAAIAIYLDII